MMRIVILNNRGEQVSREAVIQGQYAFINGQKYVKPTQGKTTWTKEGKKK